MLEKLNFIAQMNSVTISRVEEIPTEKILRIIIECLLHANPKYQAFVDQIRNSYRLELAEGYHRFYLAEDTGFLVGCGGIKLVNFSGNVRSELKTLFVVPSHTGLGIGKLLLEKVIDEAIELGQRYLYIESLNIPRTIEWYKNQGFENYAAPWQKINPVMRKRLF